MSEHAMRQLDQQSGAQMDKAMIRKRIVALMKDRAMWARAALAVLLSIHFELLIPPGSHKTSELLVFQIIGHSELLNIGLPENILEFDEPLYEHSVGMPIEVGYPRGQQNEVGLTWEPLKQLSQGADRCVGRDAMKQLLSLVGSVIRVDGDVSSDDVFALDRKFEQDRRCSAVIYEFVVNDDLVSVGTNLHEALLHLLEKEPRSFRISSSIHLVKGSFSICKSRISCGGRRLIGADQEPYLNYGNSSQYERKYGQGEGIERQRIVRSPLPEGYFLRFWLFAAVIGGGISFVVYFLSGTAMVSTPGGEQNKKIKRQKQEQPNDGTPFDCF